MMYGNVVVLLANGEPIWQGRHLGPLQKRVEKIRKWRRQSEGTLGELFIRLGLDSKGLSVKAICETVETLHTVWFARGNVTDRGEYKL